MMGGTKLPPIPYILSNMVTQKNVRKPPDDERDIKRDDELADLPPLLRREEVRSQGCTPLAQACLSTPTVPTPCVFH